VEIDLWDTEGGTFNYIDHPLDSIGINFDTIGEGARRLARILALRNATKVCWPILRMDDNHRGFPFLHMDLI
jgi:hypothetical protein